MIAEVVEENTTVWTAAVQEVDNRGDFVLGFLSCHQKGEVDADEVASTRTNSHTNGPLREHQSLLASASTIAGD